MQVEPIVEGGKQGLVAGAQGSYAKLDLREVERQDRATMEAGLDAGFDLRRKGLSRGTLASDAALDGATLGTRVVLRCGWHGIPDWEGEPVSLAGVWEREHDGRLVLGLVALALEQGPDVSGEHLLCALMSGCSCEYGDLLGVSVEEEPTDQVAVGVRE